jgi:hypothetical protein
MEDNHTTGHESYRDIDTAMRGNGNAVAASALPAETETMPQPLALLAESIQNTEMNPNTHIDRSDTDTIIANTDAELAAVTRVECIDSEIATSVAQTIDVMKVVDVSASTSEPIMIEHLPSGNDTNQRDTNIELSSDTVPLAAVSAEACAGLQRAAFLPTEEPGIVNSNMKPADKGPADVDPDMKGQQEENECAAPPPSFDAFPSLGSHSAPDTPHTPPVTQSSIGLVALIPDIPIDVASFSHPAPVTVEEQIATAAKSGQRIRVPLEAHLASPGLASKPCNGLSTDENVQAMDDFLSDAVLPVTATPACVTVTGSSDTKKRKSKAKVDASNVNASSSAVPVTPAKRKSAPTVHCNSGSSNSNKKSKQSKGSTHIPDVDIQHSFSSQLAKYAHPRSNLAKTGTTTNVASKDMDISDDDCLEIDLIQIPADSRHKPKSQRTHADENQSTSNLSSTQGSHGGSATECNICFTATDSHGLHRLCCLACGHVFGMKCVKKWLSTNKKCPVCKHKSQLDDIRPLFCSSIQVNDTGALNAAIDKQQVMYAEIVRLKGELAGMKEEREKVRGQSIRCGGI